MTTGPIVGGSIEVRFMVSAPQVPGLVLTGCTLGLEHLGLFGNVSATPQAVLHDAAIDPVATEAQTVRFDNLPQGIYSQLEFDVEHVWLDGTYMGAPLIVRADTVGPRVDLRAAPPPELLDGDDVKLPIHVDADAWWQNVDFTQLQVDEDGRFIIDAWHNPLMVVTIARGVGSCFTPGRPFY